ncbi:hypothetical protein [Ruminiclostridium hungatei]|uniref:hypothetical protein n=1 Tax=Ruminiclostridium hungatei TaxID=48256 RepID=UPI0009AC2A15|nr:hypothetical protein [Ruminiclostridium hungatei]
MGLFIKKRVHHKNKAEKAAPEIKETGGEIHEMGFEQFQGQTVTVFVSGGGEVGKGFTGVLMESCPAYIKLLMLPATPPDCSLGNNCSSRSGNILFCALCPYNKKARPGAVAVIPVSSIAAFVHNTLGGGTRSK